MRDSSVRVFAAGIIAGAVLTTGIVFAVPSKADTGFEYGVCHTLTDHPSVAGVVGIGLALGEQGFSGFEAGQIIAESVANACPWFLPVLQRFAVYGTNNEGVLA